MKSSSTLKGLMILIILSSIITIGLYALEYKYYDYSMSASVPTDIEIALYEESDLFHFVSNNSNIDWSYVYPGENLKTVRVWNVGLKPVTLIINGYNIPANWSLGVDYVNTTVLTSNRAKTINLNLTVPENVIEGKYNWGITITPVEYMPPPPYIPPPPPYIPPVSNQSINILYNSDVEIDEDKDGLPDNWSALVYPNSAIGSYEWINENNYTSVCKSELSYIEANNYGHASWRQWIPKSEFKENTLYQIRLDYKTNASSGLPIKVQILFRGKGYESSSEKVYFYLIPSENWITSDYIAFRTPIGSEWDLTERIRIDVILRTLGETYFDNFTLNEVPLLQNVSERFLLKSNFHTHTTESDGAYTPREVVDLYYQSGFDVLAITDHNTISGVNEAKEAGTLRNMTIIGGQEITCKWEDGSAKHIIGLFLNETILVEYWRTNTYEPYLDNIHQQGGIATIHQHIGSWDNWMREKDNATIDLWAMNFWDYQKMTWIMTNRKYVLDHDFHGEGKGGMSETQIPHTYTVVISESKDENDVKNALLVGNTVIIWEKCVYGSEYALKLYRTVKDVSE